MRECKGPTEQAIIKGIEFGGLLVLRKEFCSTHLKKQKNKKNKKIKHQNKK